MTDRKRRLDRILEDDYLDGLGDKPMAALREMRAECGEEEALVSYERRLLHGRLSLLRFELDRRSGKETGTLVDNLARILADERGPSRGAIPLQDPDLEAFGDPTRRVSKLVGDDTLRRLPELSEDEVRAIVAELEAVEAETSETRSKLLGVLDRLTAELGRRYQSGEADPSDVLT